MLPMIGVSLAFLGVLSRVSRSSLAQYFTLELTSLPLLPA